MSADLCYRLFSWTLLPIVVKDVIEGVVTVAVVALIYDLRSTTGSTTMSFALVVKCQGKENQTENCVVLPWYVYSRRQCPTHV